MVCVLVPSLFNSDSGTKAAGSLSESAILLNIFLQSGLLLGELPPNILPKPNCEPTVNLSVFSSVFSSCELPINVYPKQSSDSKQSF